MMYVLSQEEYDKLQNASKADFDKRLAEYQKKVVTALQDYFSLHSGNRAAGLFTHPEQGAVTRLLQAIKP